MNFPSTGLYAITQTAGKSFNEVVVNVSAAIKGGAAVIQYRDKNPEDTRGLLARALLDICHSHQVPLLINDDAELAAEIGADGVHLGKDDPDITRARALLGKDAIIGISCYDNLELAVKAEKNTATYVAFGRFFPSNSKPLASPAKLTTLINAQQSLRIPIVAIGGILPENGGRLLAAGADLLAVIGGVFDQHPEQSAQAYQKLFS